MKKTSLFTYKFKRKDKKKTFADFIKSPKFLITLGVILLLFVAFLIVGNVLGRVAEKSRSENQYSTI